MVGAAEMKKSGERVGEGSGGAKVQSAQITVWKRSIFGFCSFLRLGLFLCLCVLQPGWRNTAAAKAHNTAWISFVFRSVLVIRRYLCVIL